MGIIVDGRLFDTLQDAIDHIDQQPPSQRVDLQKRLHGMFHARSAAEWTSTTHADTDSKSRKAGDAAQAAENKRQELLSLKSKLTLVFGLDRVESLWKIVDTVWVAKRMRRALNANRDWDKCLKLVNRSIVDRMTKPGPGRRRTVKILPGDADFAYENSNGYYTPVTSQELRQLGLEIGGHGIMRIRPFTENGQPAKTNKTW